MDVVDDVVRNADMWVKWMRMKLGGEFYAWAVAGCVIGQLCRRSCWATIIGVVDRDWDGGNA